MSMRRLIRQLEESDRGTKAALTRLNREMDKRHETKIFAAKAILDSLELVVKRAKTDGYYKLKFQSRDAQKKYDEGWKHMMDALSALKNADDDDLGSASNEAMFALSRASSAFFRILVFVSSDSVAASKLPLIKGILGEISSARETWRLSTGF